MGKNVFLQRASDIQDASLVDIAVLGTPTVDQVQEYIDNVGSSGFFLGGIISDGGSGTIDITAGQGFIRQSADDNAPLLSFVWDAVTGMAVPSDTTRYIFVDDTGVVSLNASEFIEAQDNIMIGVVTDEGGAISHVFNLGVRLQESIGQAGRFVRRVFGISRDQRKGGLIFGQSGDANRDVTVTAGSLWWGRTEYAIAAFDTSGADTFDTYSAGGQEATGVSQWPNTQYDNAGTLTTMTNNRWAVLWWYIEPDGHIVMIYGRDQYVTEGQAEEELPPSESIPNRISSASVIAAKFIFQKSNNTAMKIESAFGVPFTSAGVTDHGNLAGLGDDDHTQYALLAGRSGGQTLIGGTASANDLVFNSTSHATKGRILFGDADGLNYNETDVLLSIGGAGQAITVGGTAFKSRFTTHMADVTIISGRFGGHSDTAAIAPNLLFNRSKGTEASPTVVVADNRLGIIQFSGYDGTDYEVAGSIQFDVDGTPGAGDMPGRMVISLSPDGSGTPVEVFRISQDKAVTIPGDVTISGTKQLFMEADSNQIIFHSDTVDGRILLNAPNLAIEGDVTVSLPITTNTITLGGLQTSQTWTGINIFTPSIAVTPVNDEFSQFGADQSFVSATDSGDRFVSTKQATGSGVFRAGLIVGEIEGPSTNANIKMTALNLFIHLLDTTDTNLTSTNTYGSYTGSRVVGRLDGTGITVSSGSLTSFALFMQSGATTTVTLHDDIRFEGGNIRSGSTVTSYNRIRVQDITVGGTLTTQTGIRIEDLTNAGTDFAIFLEGTNNKVHFNQTGESIGSSTASHLDLIGTTHMDFIIGSTEQMNLQDGVFAPTTDSDVDLGATARRWKDAFIDDLTLTADANIGGDFNHDGSNFGAYGTAPIAQQTGVAVTAAGIHASLVNLGLITA